MAVDMKVWTCRFPADSNLNERLREAARQANLSYYKLLAQMLDVWEKQQTDKRLQTEDLNARRNKIEKFMERLSEMLNWNWDSATGEWILPPPEQQDEAEEVK